MKTPTKPELSGINLVADFPTCFLESDSLTETMDISGGAERVSERHKVYGSSVGFFEILPGPSNQAIFCNMSNQATLPRFSKPNPL